MTSVIATVEDSLGVPSPEELAVTKEEAMKQDEETRRLAESECPSISQQGVTMCYLPATYGNPV